ncbi:MAG: MFS transporter [Verrucomicrobiota bacterium]
MSYAGMMCLAIGLNLLPVFLTTLGVDLGGEAGLTNEQLGRLGGIMFAGLVVGILVTGPLADRVGFKPFTILGNGLVALGLLLLGLAPGYGTACAAVFVLGLGAGILDMVLSPIVCALQPEHRTAAMNWLHSFYCTGAVLTVLISSLALRLGVNWRMLALWLTAVPTLVALAFVPLCMPALVADGAARTRLRDLLRKPYFLIGLGALFLGGATEVGLAQWLPAYAEKSLGYSKWLAGLALLFFSLVMAIGRITAGMVGRRLNPFSLLLGCCVGSVFLFIVGCFAPWPVVALAACMAVGITGSCLWPTTLGVVADHYPHGGASMFGMLSAFGNFGCVFMPWVVGVVADWSTMRWGLSTATLCPLLMVILVLKLRRMRPDH